eukprot:g6078.t1
MEFEWDEKEQQFLKVFLGKILQRPYAAAWNTWLEMVSTQKLFEEQQRKRKIIKRMSKVLDSQKSGERDEKGMEKIKKWALDVHGQIFTKLKEEELNMACQYMELKRYKKSEIICLQGHPGEKYMINAQGTVAVHIDMDPVNTQRKLQIYKVKGYDYMTRMIDENPLFIGKEVAQLPDGKGFGEIALFTDNSLRTASIIAADKKETKIIYIPKAIYLDTLCKYHMTAYESRMKMEYLQKHPILSDWSQRRIADLSFLVQKKAYAKNAILIHQGAIPKGIWFIKKGELKCLYYFKPSQLKTNVERQDVERKYNERKRKSKKFQKAKLKLPEKYFALKQSKAPYRELAIISAKYNAVLGGQLLMHDANKHVSPYAYLVTKDVETYFMPFENLNQLRTKGRGTKILNELAATFTKQTLRYQEQLGKSINVDIYSSRTSDFKLPFAKKQKLLIEPSNNNTSISNNPAVGNNGKIKNSLSSGASSMSVLSTLKSLDDIADWHLSKTTIKNHPSFLPRIGKSNSRLSIGKSSTAIVENRSLWKSKSNIIPGSNGSVARRKQKKAKENNKHFSKRSMALDHALDNELERHLVLERKRLGVS